jgi:hypothetical protein
VPFIIIGAVCRAASENVVEMKTVYDGANADAAAARACSTGATFNGTVLCTINMTVPRAMKAPIFVYYELTNFYQNHRRYIKSRSDSQLSATTNFADKAKYPECDPLVTHADGRVLNPCGLVANSVFNDTFSLPSAYRIDESNIAWDTDVSRKFKAPAGERQAGIRYLNESFPGFADVTDQHFIVWMRPAALPSFRKLYGRITTDLDAGTVLSFSVASNYPVSGFSGSKAIVVTTLSFLGGKNPFLGTAYIVVGVLCVALAALFALKHWVIGGRKLGDASYLIPRA